MIVDDLKTSYYAVIFTTIMTDNLENYSETAQKMEALAKLQNGFLGIESARSELGITVSYWHTLDDISRWKTILNTKKLEI